LNQEDDDTNQKSPLIKTGLLLENVLENSNFYSVIILDINYSILFCNKGAVNIYQYDNNNHIYFMRNTMKGTFIYNLEDFLNN